MNSAKVLSTIIRLTGKVDPSVAKAMKEAQSLAGSTSKNIKKYFAVAAAAVTAATVTAAVKSVQAYADYEETLNKVATIADTSTVPIGKLSNAVIKLSNQTGVAAGDVNEAVYQAISAGVQTKNAVSTVGQAVKLAKGGFTDTATAVDTLTTAMNAYNLPADKVTQVSDYLITTQNLGKTTVDKLAASLGDVIPVAAAYDVQLDNLSADLAVMTQHGIDTDKAVTYTKSMLNELADTGSTVAKVLKSKTGKSFTELTESGYSIGDVLKVLGDSVNGNATAFSNLWSNTRAGTGALALLKAGTGKYNSFLQQMQDSTGATEKAYQKMEEGIKPALNRLKNEIKNVEIVAGKEFAPVVDKITKKLDGINIDSVMKKAKTAVDWIIDNGPTVIQVAGEIAVAMAGWKAGLVISKVTAAIQKAQAAEEGMTIVQAALNAAMDANPVGAVIVVITALIAAGTILYKKCKKFHDLINKLWATIKKIKAAFMKGGLPSVISSFFGSGKSTGKSSKAVQAAYANGGTVTTPRVAVVGDAPETIVPHGNTPRNRALLAEAARGVGITEGSRSTVIQLSYAPVIKGGSAADVKAAAKDGYQWFKEQLKQYQSEREAVSFG